MGWGYYVLRWVGEDGLPFFSCGFDQGHILVRDFEKLYALRGSKNTGLHVSALCFRANLRAAAALGFVVQR